MVTEWIITEIDGKIASIAADYRHFAELAAKIAQLPPTSVDVITTQKVSTDELIAMAGTLTWEDFRLFGTKFQLGVACTATPNSRRSAETRRVSAPSRMPSPSIPSRISSPAT